MSFAFGLAVFGTALAVGMRAYLAAAVLEEQTIRNRMALESAAAAVLGELASGQSTQTTGPRTIGNRSIFLTLSRPGTKLDLAGDEPAALLEALIRQGLGRPEHGVAWRDARSLAEMSARLRLSTAIRASLIGAQGDEVLWMRARFTGGRTGWKVHDYRRLRGAATCETATP
jgi:hypothetical protein